MEKDISLSQNKRPWFTKTTLRIAIWNGTVMFLLYLLFNVFSIIILEYQLDRVLDSTIEHEMEHVRASFYVQKGKIVISNPMEFEESDLIHITETPFFLQIYTPDKKIVFHSKNVHEYNKIPPLFPEVNEKRYFDNLIVEETGLRVGYEKIYDTAGNYYGYLQLATFKSVMEGLEHEILLFNLLSFPLFILIIVIISIFLAKKSYAPVNKIIDLAKNISVTNLSERLQYKAADNDELGRLRDTLNILFDRLEQQVKQISHFTDNASHQLMTPLTVINTELEYILTHNDLSFETKQSLNVLKDQTERMIHIVNTLLIMARDCDNCFDNKRVFDIGHIVTSEIRKNYPNINIELEVEDDIFVKGDRNIFKLVIQNLVDNAIKYSSADMIIKVLVCKQNNDALFIVEDQGIGIPQAEKDHVFQRFFRTEQSMSITTTGYGLGLSLVQAIISSMKGTVAIEDNQPQGTRFIIYLKALEMN